MAACEGNSFFLVTKHGGEILYRFRPQKGELAETASSPRGKKRFFPAKTIGA